MFIPEPYAHLPFPDVIRCLYNMCDLLITIYWETLLKESLTNSRSLLKHFDEINFNELLHKTPSSASNKVILYNAHAVN